MSGTSDKMQGKAKQAVGKMTNDKKLQAKGKAQEAKGTVKDKMDDTHMRMNEEKGDLNH